MEKIRVHNINNFIPPRQHDLVWRRDTAYSYPYIRAFIDFLLREEREGALQGKALAEAGETGDALPSASE